MPGPAARAAKERERAARDRQRAAEKKRREAKTGGKVKQQRRGADESELSRFLPGWVGKGVMPWWMRIVMGLFSIAVVTALVVLAVVAAGSEPAKEAAPAATASGSTAPDGGTDASAGPSFRDEPGEFGRPSLPGTDPADQWRGAKPIAGVDIAAMKSALTGPWGLEFSTRALLGGIRDSGLGGDRSRKQRRLDAILEYSGDNVFQVMCQAGGSEVAQPDDKSLEFVTACLAAAVHGEDWTKLKTWLDQNLRSTASGSGRVWFDLSAVRMYVESDGHLISCVLTNS